VALSWISDTHSPNESLFTPALLMISLIYREGQKFAGSNPVEAVGFFKGGKIRSTPSFGREVKPWVPCRRFAACKRTLNVPWKSAFRQNSRSYSPPIVSTSAARVRNASVGVGASGGQSWNVQSWRNNKPAGCSTPVACRGRPCKQTNKQTEKDKRTR
jgi:hypothetical protein